jgi:3-isopropylmalate/(R)-2-methylmalate dehydratase large subunit
MSGRTFAEKALGAPAGTIVFRKPDLVLSHDNTASIEKIFRKMQGDRLFDARRMVVTLDHNAPPATVKLANDYQQIRQFVKRNGILKFHDAGEGICHQLMAEYARPGMLIAGSDSHTCTAGAFNAFATGIDRTETAGLWKTGETWFRVPESFKITLKGCLPGNVSSKDLVLTIIGMIGSDGADYLSVEFHGEGLLTLSIDDRMTIANMASEMGAKNAVFPCDDVLQKHLGTEYSGVWSDPEAVYKREIDIDLSSLFPVVSCPHQVDHVRAVDEVQGTPVGEALIGTCTNGRLSDLRKAAKILKGCKIAEGVQLLVIPASKSVYLEAIKEGISEILIEAGATVLPPSCGPCLGTGLGIPADGVNVISTANRNFSGRMGNPKASVYLASPETVAVSAIEGKITSPSSLTGNHFPFMREFSPAIHIPSGDSRRFEGVWDYVEVNNLNTDQMFAGNLTYEINSSEPSKIVPYLFRGFDAEFAGMARKGDIIICGENFGCGSSREHPAVGLVELGIRAVIVKSVSRIFFRSAINQGLPVIVLPGAVNKYRRGDRVQVFLSEGKIKMGDDMFLFAPFPAKLLEILEKGGLVHAL